MTLIEQINLATSLRSQIRDLSYQMSGLIGTPNNQTLLNRDSERLVSLSLAFRSTVGSLPYDESVEGVKVNKLLVRGTGSDYTNYPTTSDITAANNEADSLRGVILSGQLDGYDKARKALVVSDKYVSSSLSKANKATPGPTAITNTPRGGVIPNPGASVFIKDLPPGIPRQQELDSQKNPQNINEGDGRFRIYKGCKADPKYDYWDMDLLPAIRTNLRAHTGMGGDGQDVPGAAPGITWITQQNIARIDIAGSYPVIQSLGINSEVAVFVGAFIGRPRKPNDISKALGSVYRSYLPPTGPAADYNIQPDSWEVSEDFIKNIVNVGARVTIEITSPTSSNKDENDQVRYKDGSNSLRMVRTGIFVKATRLAARADRVYYELNFLTTDYSPTIPTTPYNVGAPSTTPSKVDTKKVPGSGDVLRGPSAEEKPKVLEAVPRGGVSPSTANTSPTVTAPTGIPPSTVLPKALPLDFCNKEKYPFYQGPCLVAPTPGKPQPTQRPSVLPPFGFGGP